MAPGSTRPEWWDWELSFTAHAELRMEQRDADAKVLVVVTTYEVSG